MTREKLNSYRATVRLIEKDKRRLENLRNNKPTAVFGKAKGSSKSFPYAERSFSVSGAYELQGKNNYEKEVQDLICKIQNSINDSIKEKLEVEKFVEGITNKLDKEIFIDLYVNGRKQEDVAREINMERSSLSKIVGRYVKA